MDKVKGLEVLTDVIATNKKHQDYERVEDLAEKYYKLVTGDGIEELLEQIITRESEDEFKQRTAITKSVCPAAINSTKLTFQKAARKQPTVRRIDYPGDADKKKLELEEFISKYWGYQSLENYLEYAYINYNYIDPNAFLITEFKAFDPLKEKAKPYPFIATSEEAIMFEYHNEILDYLIVRLPIKYLARGTEQDGYKFTMYLGMDTIVLTQVSEELQNNPDVIEIEKKFYLLEYFEPKNDKVPAMRFGCIRDDETKGRTFVSLFHSVMAYLEKTLKIDSELDLSTAMVAFPQRFAYVSPCNNPDCREGHLLDGKTICQVCQGTGKQPFHRGTMDIVTLTLPKKVSETTNAELIDLEKLMVYKGPPIDLLEFQRDYIQYLIDSVHTLMFSNNVATKSQVAKSVTATETNFGEDNRNDAVRLFAQQYSSLWEFTVMDIATFTDLNKGLIVEHKFPKDFKWKGIEELMVELKAAKDASASSSTISAIEDDINELLYSDRPDELKEIRIKNEINPFRGYSEADIRFIISQGNVPLYQRTLWENFESIFQDLEMYNQDPWLFDLALDKINELVKAKTLEYINIIQEEKTKQAEEDAKYNQPFGGGV